MKRKVKIKIVPKAAMGGNMSPGLYGTNGNRQFSLPIQIESSKFSKAPIEANSTLSAVPRDEANIEAERGEVIMTDMTGDGIPETYKVGGDRHYAGGTPLNVPPNSFVFSDTSKMKIKDEDILKMFGVSKKSGGVTPADIAKKYDINQYRKILADPDTDKLQRETAEMMITNYNLKLAKLALAQESIKGFPQGIPVVAMPYLETSQTNPAEFTQTQGQPEDPGANMGTLQYGGTPAQRAKAEEKMMADIKAKMSMFNAAQNIQKGSGMSNLWEFAKAGSDPRKTLAMGYGILSAPMRAAYDKMLESYMDVPEVSKAPLKTLPGKAKADPFAKYKADPNKPSVDSYFPDPSTITSQEEADKWKDIYETTHPTYKKEFGGGLPTFQDTGENPYDIKVPSKSSTTKGNTKKSNSVKTQAFDPNKPYAASTEAGRWTPTGQSSDNPYNTVQDWQEARKARGLKNLEHNSEASQSEAYDMADPYWKAMMWGTYGDTAKGASKAKYSEWEPKKNSSGKIAESFTQYRKRMEASGYTPEKIKEETDKLKGNFTDSKSGIREAFLLHSPEEDQLPAKLPVKEKDAAAAYVQPDINHLAPVGQPDYAPWWLQDIIKTAGAAGDFARVKKYDPWQANPDTYLPTPTFYDPTRELAANSEQANIQTQALGQFAGAQALSARSSAIQGQAAKNAADVMGRYNNLNVGTANDFETRNAGTLNEAARYKAGLDTQLFDKYTIANQQFDNSRNQAREHLRQSYIDAITNRANTYNLNSVYPQMAVDPMSGGFIHGKNFRALSNNNQGIAGITDGGRDPIASEFEKLKETYGEATALELMKLKRKGQ